MSLLPSTGLKGQVTCFQGGGAINGGAPIAITAGGTGDAAAITGTTIDTLAYRGDAMLLIVSANAKLADTKTLSVAATLQESSDGTNWDSAETLYAATVIATGATPTTWYDEVKATHVELKHRKRYIRFNVTPDLSNTGTDTATIHIVGVMGGSKVTPTA